MKFQLTVIGLRNIDVTVNFGLWETGFSIFQIQNDFYQRPFEKNTLSTTYFLTEFYDVELFDSITTALLKFRKLERESVFFASFFWIKKM